MAMFTFCNGIYAIIIQRGDFMKRHLVKKITCALAAAVMMIICSMPAFAWDMDMGYADLTFSNAPEGTKYIDILVPIFRARSYFDGTHDIKLTFIKKLRTKDSYKEETVEKTIGKDSEIAKYVDEDGWSLPSGADLLYTRSEIHHYNHVLDHYETRTRSYQERVQSGSHTDVQGTPRRP